MSPAAKLLNLPSNIAQSLKLIGIDRDGDGKVYQLRYQTSEIIKGKPRKLRLRANVNAGRRDGFTTLDRDARFVGEDRTSLGERVTWYQDGRGVLGFFT